MSNIKRMKIDFRENGEGTLECVGAKSFRCLGKPGLQYPEDSTIDPAKRDTKVRQYYSKRYSCPPNDNEQGQCSMPYALLLWGRYGIYIHEWPNPATISGNNGPTHGCIHLEKGDCDASVPLGRSSD